MLNCQPHMVLPNPPPAPLQAGFFPEWTLTEDFALGIELKKLNWQVGGPGGLGWQSCGQGCDAAKPRGSCRQTPGWGVKAAAGACLASLPTHQSSQRCPTATAAARRSTPTAVPRHLHAASALLWQCRYVPEYLAIGEAPEEVRNCFQQRSRWAKGHFQVGGWVRWGRGRRA